LLYLLRPIEFFAIQIYNKAMAGDDLKKIKELLEIVHNKVRKLEAHFMMRSSTPDLIKGQQSVMNDKLDEV